MSPTTTETGLRETVLALAGELAEGAGAQRAIVLERPQRADFGDYSTNAALLLAPAVGASPRELAQRLGDALAARLGEQLERYEVAGPGFVNLFLADSWHRAALAEVLAAGESFGRGGALAPERIIVEFVSANPTGPMHVGHARNAAYGDALARVLAFHGHQVEREFYINDAGSQVLKLGESIRALARGEEIPEDGYHGDYVVPLVAEVERSIAAGRHAAGEVAVEANAPGEIAHGASAVELDPAELGAAAVEVMVGRMQHTLAAFRVQSFDRWAYESALHEAREDLHAAGGKRLSSVDHALALLEEQGHTYRSEGALWLRTTAFGDDKDRVLVRSTGEHTYFAADIAYHQDKRERGFDRQIDVWGADHHGYVARMKAAYEALGGDPGHLEMLIMQLVHLMRRGERAQMSKRAGEFVTLEELLGEIGVDAARWFLLSRSHDTTIDLDLDLAREQSNENPVYYVQYAHARIASMLAKAGAERVERALQSAGEGGEPLHSAERALVKGLLAFPGEVREAAARRAPHRMTAYALELAQQFTAFYRDCRVLGADRSQIGQPVLESQRLALCVASRQTIARSLDLLGVDAPAEM
ncbi:MAG TPA: arginine--tRNA ligase [Solirubrobacteraceae bacterium]|nr:arginine--tRNA ligase [Solirubrobacteraceae bacterium]